MWQESVCIVIRRFMFSRKSGHQNLSSVKGVGGTADDDLAGRLPAISHKLAFLVAQLLGHLEEIEKQDDIIESKGEDRLLSVPAAGDSGEREEELES